MGDLALETVNHARLSYDDESLGVIVAAVANHFLGTANNVSIIANSFNAFGVGDNTRVRKFEFEAFDSLLGKEDVCVTRTRPEFHRTTRLGGDPLPEVLVGHKKDFSVGGNTLDDLSGISASADDIAECFDCGGTIDVRDNVYVWVCRFVGCEFFSRARVGKGATRIDIW
jgi:hypothetical protein